MRRPRLGVHVHEYAEEQRYLTHLLILISHATTRRKDPPCGARTLFTYRNYCVLYQKIAKSGERFRKRARGARNQRGATFLSRQNLWLTRSGDLSHLGTVQVNVIRRNVDLAVQSQLKRPSLCHQSARPLRLAIGTIASFRSRQARQPSCQKGPGAPPAA